MHRTIETKRAGDEPSRRRSITAGVALLLCAASIACATAGAAEHVQPYDYGKVDSITRTADAGLEIHFHGMHESAFSRFDPTLVLAGDEIERALSVPSMPPRPFQEWPRVLIDRSRLREQSDEHSDDPTRTDSAIPTERVPSELWGKWSATQPDARAPGSIRIAYADDFVDPINASLRAMALLVVKEDSAGDRRAIFIVKPPPSQPYILFIGIAVDLLLLFGVAALF